MWQKVKLIIFLSVLACCLWWPCVGGCSESRTYTISESELTALQNHLNALELNNSELLSLLNASGTDLSKASSSLTEQRNELTKLKNELTALRAETKRLSESLQTANAELQKALESVNESEKEHRKRENQLERQRLLWQIISVIVGGVAIAK